MKNMFSKKKKFAKITNVYLLTEQHKKQTNKKKIERETGRDQVFNWSNTSFILDVLPQKKQECMRQKQSDTVWYSLKNWSYIKIIQLNVMCKHRGSTLM